MLFKKPKSVESHEPRFTSKDKDMISTLEKRNTNHQRSINSFYRQFDMLLDYLDIEIEEIPKTAKLVPRREEGEKDGTTED